MNKLYAWSNQIKIDIEKQKDQIYNKDYKFFKIDRLERIAERIDEFSDQCDDCEQFKKMIETLAMTYTVSITGSSKEKSEFEKNNELIIKHLKQKHRLVQKDYYIALYSFLGFLIGTILIGLISLLINTQYLSAGLLIGFSIGMITGRIIGKRKDHLKIRYKQVL
jgi:hypothetical protein